MPRKHHTYPYVETAARGYSNDDIHAAVQDMISQNPGLNVRDGGPLDPLCRALNVDLEYSDIPNEILLEVPLDRKAVVWLPKNSKPRHDRLAAATGIGHWVLHIPRDREDNPGCGIQALYQPSNGRTALEEARKFALALLMPQDVFKNLWYEGKAHLVANTLNVPTAAAYERASMISIDQDTDHSDDTSQVTFRDPLGILAPKDNEAATGSA